MDENGMDSYIKRLKQLVFGLALAGLFSHYAISSYLDATRDFGKLEHLFFSTLLLSDSYSARIDWFEDEVAKDGYISNYQKVKDGLAAARILLGEQTYLFKGAITVDGVQFGLENLASIHAQREHVGISEIGAAPPIVLSAEMDKDDYLVVEGSTCPPLRIAIRGDFALALTCFHIWRADAPNIEAHFWLSDGRPFWNGADFIKDNRTPHLATGGRFLTEEELGSQIALIAERNGVVKNDTAARYFSFRNKLLSQRFKVPVIGVDADIVDYYRLLAAVAFVLSVILLHSCVCLFDRSGDALSDEPWILRPGRLDRSLTGILRAILLSLGAVFFIGALALPVSALLRFAFELDLRAHLLIEVRYITAASTAFLVTAAAYVTLALFRQSSVCAHDGAGHSRPLLRSRFGR